MLFNKKPEDEVKHDFSPNKRIQSVVAPIVEQSSSLSRKSNGGQTRSVIDAWLTITGNLESEGEVQVDGEIHGDIRCAHLTIGRDATVVGNITAEEVVVRGNVKGVIRANRVILQDSAHVDSEIFHKTIAIEEGACFEGTSRRHEDPMNVEIGKPAAAALQSMASDMKSASNGSAKHGVADAAVA
jgi:cytoskeletal protein CcmA (bactofilin family)